MGGSGGGEAAAAAVAAVAADRLNDGGPKSWLAGNRSLQALFQTGSIQVAKKKKGEKKSAGTTNSPKRKIENDA